MSGQSCDGELCMVAIADEGYQAYIPFFIDSLAGLYPSCHVRILYHGRLYPETERSLALLEPRLDFSVRGLPAGRYADRQLFKATRWVVHDPVFDQYRYLEIGDIDRYFAGGPASLCRAYLDHCERTGLPYSNVVRGGSRKLTGIHFVQTQWYFPSMAPVMDKYRPLVLSEGIRLHNEELLYTMVEESGLGFPSVNAPYRHHGIHLRIFQHDEPAAFYREQYDYQFKILEENAAAFLTAAGSDLFGQLMENLERTQYDQEIRSRYADAGPGLLQQLRRAADLCRELLGQPG